MKPGICDIAGTIGIVLKSAVLAIVLTGCYTTLPITLDWGNYDFNKHHTDTISVKPGGGVNLLLPPGKSAGYLLAYLRSYNIHVDPKKVRICDCADSSFINIDDASLTFQLTGEGKPRVTQTGALGGAPLQGVVVAISENHSIGIGSDPQKDRVNTENYIPLNANRYQDLINTFPRLNNPQGRENVLVAVFDSGLDPVLLDDNRPWWTSSGSINCRSSIAGNSRVKGVNFVSDVSKWQVAIPRAKNYLDDNPRTENPHGTFVTALLVKEFLKTTNAPNLGLLVMRVLNNQRSGDSFGLNCAMLTARKLGAEIFNMSLGYRGEEDPVFVKILDQFEKDGLGSPPLLVVAAGNDGMDMDRIGSNDNFYPARLGRRRGEIITVTTLSGSIGTEAVVCEGQNFGMKSVDVGVWTDKCIFPSITNPDDNKQQWQVSIEGSSYATPLITGWIAATKSRNTRRKKEMVLKIRGESPVLQAAPGIVLKIKKSRAYRSPAEN